MTRQLSENTINIRRGNEIDVLRPTLGSVPSACMRRIKDNSNRVAEKLDFVEKLSNEIYRRSRNMRVVGSHGVEQMDMKTFWDLRNEGMWHKTYHEWLILFESMHADLNESRNMENKRPTRALCRIVKERMGILKNILDMLIRRCGSWERVEVIPLYSQFMEKQEQRRRQESIRTAVKTSTRRGLRV